MEVFQCKMGQFLRQYETKVKADGPLAIGNPQFYSWGEGDFLEGQKDGFFFGGGSKI